MRTGENGSFRSDGDALASFGQRSRGHVTGLTVLFAVLVVVGSLLVLYQSLLTDTAGHSSGVITVAVIAPVVCAVGLWLLITARRSGSWPRLLTACGVELLCLVVMAVAGQL